MSLQGKYSKKGQAKAYYDALMKKCDLHLEQMEQELPAPGENFEETRSQLLQGPSDIEEDRRQIKY